MKTLSLRLFLLSLVLVVALGGCTVTHETMRSSIVMKLEKEAHICIGKDDGIKVGDILTVYRRKEVPVPNEPFVPDRSGRYRPKVRYEMVKVGRARVTAIMSEHYAAIVPIALQLEMTDIVEKTRGE